MPTKPIKPQGVSDCKKPQNTKEAKVVTTGQDHQGPSGPGFIPIHRDWMGFKYDKFPSTGTMGQAQYSTVDAAPNAAMQRWEAEAMRSQPFHGIKAVALPETRSVSHNQSESQRSGSSVGYVAD
ncbi:Uncharacterized protein BP5553_02781 [Venustampulla echinocandica]|uniref:Uncharacterized protein n=1 Tax=Venustampulla echinocandica TaxID=2656787 RepID=A0A370TSD5_9HELO|nr:Uncharacterized protein BP5553_02781 [Venustampulla echinocandica]RDL38441.1 Uncharacterized protein BP5553_02781 [Venustampulla echinocandica]